MSDPAAAASEVPAGISANLPRAFALLGSAQATLDAEGE